MSAQNVVRMRCPACKVIVKGASERFASKVRCPGCKEIVVFQSLQQIPDADALSTGGSDTPVMQNDTSALQSSAEVKTTKLIVPKPIAPVMKRNVTTLGRGASSLKSKSVSSQNAAASVRVDTPTPIRSIAVANIPADKNGADSSGSLSESDMAPDAMPAGSSSSKKRIPVLIAAGVAAVLVVIVCALVFLGKSSAFAVPEGSTAFVSFGSPVNILDFLVSSSEVIEKDDASFLAFMDTAREKGKAAVGFDPFDKAAYDVTGIDMDTPIHFVVGPTSKNGMPNTVVLGIGIKDSAKARAFLIQGAQKDGSSYVEAEDDSRFLINKKDREVVFFDKNIAYVATGPQGDQLEELRTYLRLSEEKPFTEDPDYQEAISGLDASQQCIAYLNFKNVPRNFARMFMGGEMSELNSMCIGRSDERVSIALSMPKASQLRQAFQQGAACRDFIAKADKPIFAGSFSSKYLGDQICSLGSSSDMSDKLSMKCTEFDTSFWRMTGIEPLLLNNDRSFNDGAIGVLAYLDTKDSVAEVKELFFLKTKNAEKHIACFKNKAKRNSSYIARPCGDNTLYVRQSTVPAAIALVDGYVVWGEAVEQICRLAEGKSAGWTPAGDGTEIVSTELFFSDLLAKLPKSIHDAIPSELLETEHAATSLTLRLTLNEKGLLLETQGQSMLAVSRMLGTVIIPNLVSQRISINESRIMDALNLYVAAQKKYKEEGYSYKVFHAKDGSSEYSASISRLCNIPIDNSSRIHLLPTEIADSTSWDRVYCGYYFRDSDKRLDPKNEFGVMAIPCDYGKSGTNTYWVDQTGVVRLMDRKGQGLSSETDPQTWQAK